MLDYTDQTRPIEDGEFATALVEMLSQHLREMERDGLIVWTDLLGRRMHVLFSSEFRRFGDNAAHRCFDPVGVCALHLRS